MIVICIVISKMAHDADEAQKLQQGQLSAIEKLEMQKALLQVCI